MSDFDRLPALPLAVNDPYFSLWLPGDTLTSADVIHWSGAIKHLRGNLRIDGRWYRYLGTGPLPAMTTRSLHVLPTRTVAIMEGEGVELTLSFWSPALPDDPNAFSTPITYVDFSLQSLDGANHEVRIVFSASAELCFDGAIQPPMAFDSYSTEELQIAYMGQQRQHLLNHSGDALTMDWGYLYMASACGKVMAEPQGLEFDWRADLANASLPATVLLGYDDVASIQYFGVPCRAWHMGLDQHFPQALRRFQRCHDRWLTICQALDAQLLEKAISLGGEDYALIVSAAWRQTLGAHKLIATPDGQMALFSKENDSNGCLGTVDVSYPSAPLFLLCAPELVNALCLPVLTFASMPVWNRPYPPHDVGRYPHASGQVYGAYQELPNGAVYPPWYLYPAGCDLWDEGGQMPLEECGNMLILLAAALHFGASDHLVQEYAPLLAEWAEYLAEYGEEPGEQLCTDDFAGHLAGNVNLAAKSAVALACYARILDQLHEDSRRWRQLARQAADRWLHRFGNAPSPLTSAGGGWSLKYNLVWDRILNLGLFPSRLFAEETAHYLTHIAPYGIPLDVRASYTKSDWQIWCAAMADNPAALCKISASIAHYLRSSAIRVPFSDWYDTLTGIPVAFKARSVQGGMLMPLLRKWT